MRISDWSSDVCSSDLEVLEELARTLRKLVRVESARPAGGIHPLLDLDVHHRGTDPLDDIGETDRQASTRGLGDGWVERDLRLEIVRRDDRGRPATDGKRQYRRRQGRSEEHTSELQSLMRISYAVF